jgi:lysozyme family protein
MIDEIITDILKAEGWDKYTNHPADRGGPTKWGITLKAWGDYLGKPVTDWNVKGIKEAEARVFYREKYIVGPGFHALSSDFLKALVVDAAVNHGPRAATKWLQRAAGVQQDGALGPITIRQVNRTDDVVLALKFLAYRVKFYGYLVTRDPSQAVFAHGWNARAAKWLERLVVQSTGF